MFLVPVSFNGCGTRFYGECDYSVDGSYTTTYWLIFLYIPVIPCYSVRLFHIDGSTKNNYQYEKLLIHWRQVLRTWGFVALTCLGAIACLWAMEQLHLHYNFRIGVFMVCGFTIALLPSFLRYQAKKEVARIANKVMPPIFTKKIPYLIIILMVCIGLFTAYLNTQS